MRKFFISIIILLALCIPTLSMAQDSVPGNSEITARAYAACRAKQNENCLALANQSVKQDSKNPIAYCVRGMYWQQKRNYKRAVADLDHAVRLARSNPKLVLPQFARGLLALEMHDYALADRMFTAFLSVHPEHAVAHAYRYQARTALGDEVGAAEDRLATQILITR